MKIALSEKIKRPERSKDVMKRQGAVDPTDKIVKRKLADDVRARLVEMIETGMAADMADAEDIQKLCETLDNQRRHLKKDKLASVKADMAFHIAIAAIPRNPIFEATSKDSPAGPKACEPERKA